MNNKNLSNNFVFSLYQKDVLLFEGSIDANQFSPYTRNSIDIRSILPKVITILQKTLSMKNYDVEFNSAVENSLNFYKYNQNLINTYPQHQRNSMYYNPKSITYEIDGKVIKGVECKLGLYVNNNTIVEREFYVDGFNPVSRWSNDLTSTCKYIVDLINKHIQTSDINNIWDDYDLINKMGLSTTQIRELPDNRRRELLRKIHNN